MQQALDSYYAALQQYGNLNVTHETALRSAMQILLAEAGREVKWTLVPEQKLPNGRVPDGTFRDDFNLARGYWEAKDTKDDLETEIRKKIAAGYPLNNIVFEDTRRAVLFQGKSQRIEFDLTKRDELRDLLRQMTTYQAPDIQTFHQAIDEFAERLPDLARGLTERVATERSESPEFAAAFDGFYELCRASLDPNITEAAIAEMLVQHLLTERLFRTVFANPDFTRRNVIAVEIEKVIDALTRRAFNRADFLASLDRFYAVIENEAKTITDWQEKQRFLNRVYERFFQGYSVRQADALGIVYTPQEIVSFMCGSVEHLLKTEFDTSLSEEGVTVLDPCTGTGNFLVNLIRSHLSPRTLAHKYANELFANEIMLLPYYVASLNIEHEYFERMSQYQAFEGLCYTDTLDLAKDRQTSMFAQRNTDRVENEQKTPLTVIFGNPPYNAGQKNENDNNKNRPYPIIDKHISETYVKASSATLRRYYYDPYVKFFRWATDRLRDQDGIVAFVTNNSFVSSNSLDGIRKLFADEFTSVYHLDMGGNMRRGVSNNVFPITVGVGITFLVRRREGQDLSKETQARVFYFAQDDAKKPAQKLAELKEWASIENVSWRELTPDKRGAWLTDGLELAFDDFLPMGTKEGKASRGEPRVLFKTYSPGLSTNRDLYVYNSSKAGLEMRVKQLISDYNTEVLRYQKLTTSEERKAFKFPETVKWSEHLKAELMRGRKVKFDASHIRRAAYRPFCEQWLYYDGTLNDRPGLFSNIFPNPQSEKDNTTIVLSDQGHRAAFAALAVNRLPDLHLLSATDGYQCFPFYTYSVGGKIRRENITDWALKQFQEAQGADVTKWDIFHYVYAQLHDPDYIARYAANLRRELPRIPLGPPDDPTRFRHYVTVGKELMGLHRNWQSAKEYKLKWKESKNVPFSWHVDKMKFSRDKTGKDTKSSHDRMQVVVNESLTLHGVPAEVFRYRLGIRSALEWVLDQHEVKTDKRTGIVRNPNLTDNPEYIVRLVGKAITVSLESLRLIDSLRPNLTPSATGEPDEHDI